MFEKSSFRDLYEGMALEVRRRRPELTDLEEGSVLRSLLESFSYELAVLYEQMDLVYRSGFIDTATGANLDRVVAVLGITRNEPDFALGEVTFMRDPGSSEMVAIPVGTLLSTEEDPNEQPSKRLFLTIEEAVLPATSTSVDVKVQAEERGSQMVADSGTVVVMPRPVPGVKAVTNKRPIGFRGREREADEELRERAKKALLASGRASTTAIENALLGMPRVREVRIRERFDARPEETNGGGTGAGAGGPGVVEVFVDGMDTENAQEIRKRVDDVRAAGIFAITSPARAISVHAELRIDVDPSMPAAERAEVEQEVGDAVYKFVDRIRMGQPLLFSQLTREALSVKGVSDLKDFRVTTFREEESARGTVTFHRPEGATGALTIPSRQLLETTKREGFVLDEAVLIKPQEASASGTARALTTGREGELLRSGGSVSWQPVTVGGVAVEVTNDTPFLLPRTPYDPDSEGKRVPAGFEEILIPDTVRVASEAKALDVAVMVYVAFPNPAAQREIARNVQAAIEAIPADSLVPSDAVPGLDKATRKAVAAVLAEWLDAARKSADAVKLRVYATPSDEIRKMLTDAVKAYFDAPPQEPDAADAAPVEGDAADAPPQEPDADDGPPVVVSDALEQHLEAVLGKWIEAQGAEVLRVPLRARLALVLEAFSGERLDAFPSAQVREAIRTGVAAVHQTQTAALAKDAKQLADELGARRMALAQAALAVQKNPDDTADYQAKQNALLESEKAQRELDARKQALAEDQAAELEKVEALVARIRSAAEAALAGLRTDDTLDGLAGGTTLAGRFQVSLRLRTVTFDGETLADAPRVRASLVEYLNPAVVFVYSRRVELRGRLTLTLPLTATAEERGIASAGVRQAVIEYLDGLRPEEKVDLERIREVAAAQEGVLRATLEVSDALKAEKGRVTDKKLTVHPYEKVVLGSPGGAGFDIVAA